MAGQRPPPPPPPTGDQLVAKLDSDDSGSLSATEIADSKLAEFIGDGFDGVDTDSDGLLSATELGTFGQSQSADQAKGSRPPPPPPSGTADAESIILSLFDAFEIEDEGDAVTTAEAEDLYTQIQDLLAAAA